MLGIRVKPYLTQIVSTILWRLNNKSAKVRQQAADLTSRLAVVIKQCGEDQLLSKLGLVLFEQLGEEYPDTLGSIIAAEGAIANVVGMTQMNPPVKDLRESLLVMNALHDANAISITSASNDANPSQQTRKGTRGFDQSYRSYWYVIQAFEVFPNSDDIVYSRSRCRIRACP